MFKTILIPLDGSALAEAAVPAAVAIATSVNPASELVLVRVAPDLWIDDILLPEQLKTYQANIKQDCQDYLDACAEPLRKNGISVTVLVASGEPADQILDVAAIAHADLIAMATHGRSGLQRIMLGSIADKVIHRASMPVLLFRPPESLNEADQNN
jgi:nucleotide-binding universal stress UspA family protein